MSPRVAQIQLAVLAALATCVTVGSLVYVSVAQPPSLRQTRDGVPFFTPPVINPDSGRAQSVESLVEHFKGGG